MINKLYEGRAIPVQKQDLIKSFIHMSLNRIFRTNNRLHEMVIYDLLFRAYKEQYHRSSNIQAPNSKQIQNSNDSNS